MLLTLSVRRLTGEFHSISLIPKETKNQHVHTGLCIMDPGVAVEFITDSCGVTEKCSGDLKRFNEIPLTSHS